jgi:hypothetical protein
MVISARLSASLVQPLGTKGMTRRTASTNARLPSRTSITTTRNGYFDDDIDADGGG